MNVIMKKFTCIQFLIRIKIPLRKGINFRLQTIETRHLIKKRHQTDYVKILRSITR